MSTMPIEDDSWSDLAAELGLEPVPQENLPADREELPASSSSVPSDEVAADLNHQPETRSEPEIENEVPDAIDSEADDTVIIPDLSSEIVAEEPGEEPGKVRKRRRRRRRRKKSGSTSANGAEIDTTDDMADEEEAEDGPVVEVEEIGGQIPEDDLEEPAAELARDVIANWNVPSWEQIIAGLYRPDR